MRYSLNGHIVADGDAPILRWWGIPASCPADIRGALAQNPEGEEFVLEINSGGGSVFAGFEMYSLLRNASRQGVHTRAEVQSLAGSAASVVMAGADTAAVSPVGQVMIHLPSTITEGNQGVHRESVQMLESITESIIAAYEGKVRGKTSHDALRRLMDRETFLSARAALDAGLVDEIIGEEPQPGEPVNPANIFNAVGGLPDMDMFTAYYPAANALEGGFLDAQGNRLDPSKKTCAAPPSVAFGTKVTVQGTGTSLDGETYTVNDRGGAIQIENGVYHFDLLMRTNAECNSWGRKTGTAILGGTSGGGSASSFVNTALGEVGYREGSGNRTKYGAEMGCDGVAWCVIFVCWCAKHSSAPIPTTYTAVGEMRSYFERRGKFKSVASGYRPKAGDLMIIGSSHIGIVLSGGASSCETVEGNYSDGVGRVKRSYSEITGFCCPW